MEDDMEIEVDALHRFLTDPQAQKQIMGLVSMFANAQEADDEEMEMADLPEISRNDRVLILKGVYQLLEDVLGSKLEEDPDAEDEEDGDEEYASLKKVNIEIAKDKRMSTYYKAFMGNMRSLVNPWFDNRDKFLSMWVDMGNSLYSKSPSKPPKELLMCSVMPAPQTDEENTEEASLIGGAAALPAKVARTLTDMGFLPVENADEGDAAWVKSGVDAGFSDLSVYVIRREDKSYLVLLTRTNTYDTYGRPLKRRVLDQDASDESILRAVAFAYDSMVQE